jgi:hypothetical protein
MRDACNFFVIASGRRERNNLTCHSDSEPKVKEKNLMRSPRPNFVRTRDDFVGLLRQSLCSFLAMTVISTVMIKTYE